MSGTGIAYLALILLGIAIGLATVGTLAPDQDTPVQSGPTLADQGAARVALLRAEMNAYAVDRTYGRTPVVYVAVGRTPDGGTVYAPVAR